MVRHKTAYLSFRHTSCATFLVRGRFCKGEHRSSAVRLVFGSTHRCSPTYLFYTLNEIVDSGGHISAEYNINSREHCHSHNDHPIRNVKNIVEKRRKAVVKRSSVGNKENEYDKRGNNLQLFGILTLFKVECLRQAKPTKIISAKKQTSIGTDINTVDDADKRFGKFNISQHLFSDLNRFCQEFY